MANNEGTPTPSDDEALELETFDADHDGKIGLIDGYRATLGLVDAELEIAA
ncbi:MAG: hypothetical protein F2868_15810, partial [Actinobacteria bacterium]|nr:hypothetical protein [Actinomycetota bacterium]